MRSSRFLIRSLFACILLLTLSHSDARGQSGRWAEVAAERGRVSRATRSITNNCPTAQHFRVTSGEKFIRFSPKADAVFVEPSGRTPLGLRIDATQLQPKTYPAKALVACLDCRPPCNMTQTTILMDVNVVEPAPRRRQEPPGDDAEAKAIEDALKKGLRRASEAFRGRERKLRPIKGVVPGTEQKVEGYDREEVLALLAETKADLLRLLERRELRPFRDYVDADFPAANLKTVGVETGRAAASPAPEGFARLSPQMFRAARAQRVTRTLATAESTQAALENVAYFIAAAESNSDRFTLSVFSEPDGANVTLATVDGEPLYPTSTNSDIPSIWIGIYRITVKKDGFREVVHGRQKLGDPATTMRCTLVTSGTPRFCQFQ